MNEGRKLIKTSSNKSSRHDHITSTTSTVMSLTLSASNTVSDDVRDRNPVEVQKHINQSLEHQIFQRLYGHLQPLVRDAYEASMSHDFKEMDRAFLKLFDEVDFDYRVK